MSDSVCKPGYRARTLREPKRHRCVATRMSSATVYDRQLPLDFAAPRTYASSTADWVALLGLKAHVDSVTLNAVVGPKRSHAYPTRKIRAAGRSAQRHQGGARRAGDSRVAECHVGLILQWQPRETEAACPVIVPVITQDIKRASTKLHRVCSHGGKHPW